MQSVKGVNNAFYVHRHSEIKAVLKLIYWLNGYNKGLMYQYGVVRAKIHIRWGTHEQDYFTYTFYCRNYIGRYVFVLYFSDYTAKSLGRCDF